MEEEVEEEEEDEAVEEEEVEGEKEGVLSFSCSSSFLCMMVAV